MGFFNRFFGFGKPRRSYDTDKSWIDEMFPDPIDVLPALYGQLHGRADDASFKQSPSWFGGVPMLGDKAWPRCVADMPMTHIATVDLGETARLAPDVALPHEGHLAFFLPMSEDRQDIEVAVLHITNPAPCAVPEDLSKISQMAGGAFRGPSPDHDDLRFLRRYPVRFTTACPASPKPMDVPNAAYLSAQHLADCLPNGADPWLWDSLQRFAVSLPRRPADLDAAQARVENSLARAQKRFAEIQRTHAEDPTDGSASILANLPKTIASDKDALNALTTQRASYAAMARDFLTMVQDQDPWTPVTDAALNEARRIFESIRKPFGTQDGGLYASLYHAGDGTCYHQLSYATSETIGIMAHAAPDVFRKLPEPVQRLAILKQDSPQRSHSLQMFGTGLALQDAMELNADKHMLMQFGGADHLGLAEGSIKVWISPDDLAAGRFDQARVSYEYD